MNILIKPGGYKPLHAHAFDAGYDLLSPVDVLIDPGASAVVDTRVCFEIPAGYVGMIKSKSGLNVNYGVQSEGVIDSGYTGSVTVRLDNHGNQTVGITAGQKLAQIVFLPVFLPDLVEVQELATTERGANGFGSTGR